MDEYCKENNFSAWFETSAKENINIDDAARSLVSQVMFNFQNQSRHLRLVGPPAYLIQLTCTVSSFVGNCKIWSQDIIVIPSLNSFIQSTEFLIQ